MVFSSLIFLFVFLPITLLIYYISPRPIRNLVLFIVSLIFYAWGEPIYILIMLFSTFFDYFNGLFMDKYRDNKKITNLVLINSLVVNLGILCFFKYYGFIITNINNFFSLNLKTLDLPLPLGISFYTFQTLSYTIDVYLDKVPVQKNIISFGTYVTMFPQLVAGPIVRYSDVAWEIDNRKESLGLFGEGAELFVIGLSKKVLLANSIGALWKSVKAIPIENVSILSAWLGIIAFTFQIYFDFSGYSDMAIGLGKMFGFNFMKNFDYPYISKSVTEFWRRWHISLGTWFKEYVYIPLGGNRLGRLKQYRNLFIVWFLTGLWHGANWNFILWGLYYFVFLVIEKTYLNKWLKDKPKFISHIYTLLVVIIGWVFFEFENISEGMKFIQTMFGIGGNPVYDGTALYYLYTNWILFVVLAICSTPLLKKRVHKLKEDINTKESIVYSLIILLLLFLCTAYLVNESYNPFLYFRF
ncbi:alginate O-acetyltransferase complex protein AlgI [Sporanaerobacter acetigenes DSM 13106]|uniref:Alginate O-acetyltransferase complex protein AlgI n=2 Tax=Sporanaerobacter acetigenes TaxID=165813 RepID=A0A1M5WSU3_9FIRM|nr:alginate O-acetyltransferase complex protein AlgI [Sporanaerobacter acetigenes DSM 13106]